VPDTRQAVIVIHGMGEQRPMSTLRAFVEAAIPAPGVAGRPRYRSKPDDLTDSFELRKYTVGSTASRPVTDMFEFYWADKMTGTKLRDLLPLMRALLLRAPWKLRGSVRPFWLVGWLLLLAVVAVAAMTVLQRGPLALLDSPGDILSHLTGEDDKKDEGAQVSRSSIAGWLTLAAILAVGWFQAFAIASFGDVARYLDNKPGNVGVRHDIKAAGRDILKSLHESGRYDRIVVVGHSLGSIVGLDMIANYWSTVQARHGRPAIVNQEWLDEVERIGPGLAPDGRSDYLNAQRNLWLEQRTLGVPSLVTDFVSVGSPLSHADWLMADGRAPLMELFIRRELLHDPPQVDDQSPPPYSYPVNYDTAASERRTLFVLHHAAAFACTRWHNIWFPTKWGIFGDPFGGPVEQLFGVGVVDEPVTAGPWWSPRHVPVLAHTKYWNKPDPAPGQSHPAGHHIRLLRDALDLDSNVWLPASAAPPVPPPPAPVGGTPQP
jgi:hypothetical protein